MKLLSSFLGFSVGQFPSSILHNDIYFQSCQATFLENHGWQIPSTLKNDEDCSASPDILEITLWDDHWDPKYKKYVIPFYFAEGFEETAYFDEFQNLFTGESAIAEVRKQAQEFKENTCVEFLEISETDLAKFPTAFKIDEIDDPDYPCVAFLGQEANQTVYMRPDCPKMNDGTGVLHLFMHILGFTHESSRFDRDEHIGVNRKFSATTEFSKFPKEYDALYDDYDFSSILHHPAYLDEEGLPNVHVPSRPSQLAPVELQPPFSESDLLKISLKYPCSSKSECLQNPPPCGHGLNDCEDTPDGFKCICADGFELKDGVCVDINECVDPELNTCSNPGDCINTEGGFRCDQKKIDIVWLIDGTGSYKSYQEDAKKAFKDQVEFLKNLQASDEKYNEFEFRMGMTFFADRLFTQNEMTSPTNKVYQAGLALKDVNEYSFDSAFDAAFAKINEMYGGGDSPEDQLLGIIFTMTDPEVQWDPDSIKQVHVFTDVEYHYDSLSSRHPPLRKWANQPSSLYTFYDRDLANDFTFGFIRDLEIAGIDFSYRPEIAIDQLYFNVAGSESSKRAYDYFTKGISGTLEDWMPVDPTNARQDIVFNPDAFKRNISEHDNIEDQFADMEEIIIEAVEESLEIDNFVDFCSLSPDQCHPDAKCENKETSLSCTCNEKFEGDGFYCSPINLCKNDPCNAVTEKCLFSGPAEYSCECKSGFKKAENGQCEDINECENSDICPLGNTCENTHGSYKCNCDQPGWFFVEDICVQGSICDSFTNICGDEMVCSDVEINGEIRDYECKLTATTTTVTERIETTAAMETTTSAFLKISMNMIIFFVSFILLQ